jgi:hypothetical protein
MAEGGRAATDPWQQYSCANAVGVGLADPVRGCLDEHPLGIAALTPKFSHRPTILDANAIAGVARDLGGCVSVKLKSRIERLPVSDAHEHLLFRKM